jgi:hypothetical protein
MKLIQTQTLTSAQPSITFSAIPQNFTDLYVLLSVRSSDTSVTADGGYDPFLYRVNGLDSGYSGRQLLGYAPGITGSASEFARTASVGGTWGRITNTGINNANTTANTFSSISFHIPNYTGSSAKSLSCDLVTENNSSNGLRELVAHLNTTTSPITTLAFALGIGNYVAGSTVSLYGIGGVGDGYAAPKATGGVISYASGYIIHTFFASGTFTPTANLTDVEYLVVAGGGGGSVPHGGGGAGGYRCSVTGESSGGGASAESKLSLTSGTNYTVTVGAGGAGASAGTVNFGTSGGNSVFGSITSTGGGAGGRSDANGLTGGSGGGNGYIQTTIVNNGTTNQGFRGGAGGGNAEPYYPSGGGGGAGSVGGTGTSSSDNGGDGGSGVTSVITGTAVARAGGGAGGNYGNVTGGTATAGGGNAGTTSNTSGSAGTINTGGGGGSSISTTTSTTNSGAAGAGGSGIVIVRYAA